MPWPISMSASGIVSLTAFANALRVRLMPLVTLVYRLRKTRLLCGGDQPISQVFHISEVARPISARADTYRNAFNRGLNEVFASAVSGAIHESCSYTDDVHVEVQPIRPAEHLRSVFGSIVMTDR